MENKYILKHVNGDFEVSMEFSADNLCEVISMIKSFLKACTFSTTSVDEYIQED